jgi:hypothetical protein
LKVPRKVFPNVDENLSLELFDLDTLLVAKVNIDNILFFLIVSEVYWQVRLRSILYFGVLKAFIMLVLAVTLFNVFNIPLSFNFGLFCLIEITGLNFL